MAVEHGLDHNWARSGPGALCPLAQALAPLKLFVPQEGDTTEDKRPGVTKGETQ